MKKTNQHEESTRNVTLAHYSPRVEEGRENFDILDWGDESSQFRRFEVLTEEVDLTNKSILDIGCGLADLKRFLDSKEIKPDHYVGVDLVLPILEHARKQQPETDLVNCDIFSHPPFHTAFDAVFCSGVFNLRTEDNMTYLETALRGIVKFTDEKSKVVLNFLHHRTPKKYDHCFYYDPEKVIAKVGEYFGEITLREEYLINDFTIVATQKLQN